MSETETRPFTVPEVRPLSTFRHDRAPDILERCRRFSGQLDLLRARGLYQPQFRLELLGPIDREITVRDPFTARPRRMLCFDSNSYLGLHLHPRVVSAVHRTLGVTGYGTPSAQMLAGTNRWLRELEDVVAAFHGREAALVFPSGYAASIGILTGLLKSGDIALRDRFSHASLHDGCVYSGARGGTYGHRDVLDLDRLLSREDGGARMVVTDGVFSMHGSLAPLPELMETAHRHHALLMVDEAHGTGVLGETGRGIEEHFRLPTGIDVLMGTFSKAAGSAGGYVVGSRELVDTLRFSARSGLFTASLPAPTCAGIAEAFRVMDDEPEHRERLAERTRTFHEALVAAGVPPLSRETPIASIVVGTQEKLLAAGRDLFDAGLRCGVVAPPAVPADQCLLRLTVNARHTADDLERAVEIVSRTAVRHGFAAAGRVAS